MRVFVSKTRSKRTDAVFVLSHDSHKALGSAVCTSDHLLLTASGETASPGSCLGPCSPVEPVTVASAGRGPLNLKAEQVVPAAQAWSPALAMPGAGGCPAGPRWETLQQYSRHCPRFPCLKKPQSSGWQDGCSGSRAPHPAGPGRPGPLLLCGLSPGVVPMPSEAAGQEAGSQPDICILTLAMMIAGIPTVPVPGLRQEDLIRAAQAFMMAHPEPAAVVEAGPRGQVLAHTASGQMPLVRSRKGQPPGSCL